MRLSKDFQGFAMNIQVEDLHFSYPNGVEAIQGINLEINSGELVAIVGQNGSGKTTLVKHFNGLLKPTKGTVTIGDWQTTEHTVARLASRVGYVFQNPDEQLFTKTVLDELRFGPQNLGYPEAKIEELVSFALEITDLQGEEDTNPYDLSPTWRKMVALGSIIAMDTPIVIFDEPTTGQDAVNVSRIQAAVQALAAGGKTVITISHDIDFCAENFQRIVALRDGKVLLDGSSTDVFSHVDELASTFVDPPQITRLGAALNIADPVVTISDFLEAFQEGV
jgi:energy-coupling factor transport system ATP-binding protein